VQADRPLAVDDVGAEPDGLMEGPVGQLGAADAAGEPQVVADHGGGPGLPAGRLRLQQGRAQPLRGSVHGRGQPGRSATDHGDVIGVRGRPGGGRQRLGDLGKGGIAQDQAVEGDHHRELLGGRADLLQQRAALLGVSRQEAVQDLVAGQQVPELMGAGRPLLTDHLDGLETGTVQLRPLVQQPDDQLVEALVAGLPRLQAPVVDLAEDGRPDQTVTHLQVTPAGQQRPLGRRVQSVHLGQQLDPAHVRHPHVGQHQRHRPTARLDLLQRPQRGRPRPLAEHLVVGSVALAQLCLDAAARSRLVINRQQHRSQHGQLSRSSSPWLASLSGGRVAVGEQSR
jgi:hypothetical protein